MLRATCRRFSISPFTLFMIEQKKNPVLKELAIGARGKMTAKMYKALSPKDMRALQKRAAAAPSFKRSKKRPVQPRRPSKYNLFQRKNIKDPKLRRLPVQKRMKIVAQRWVEQQKGKQVTKAKDIAAVVKKTKVKKTKKTKVAAKTKRPVRKSGTHTKKSRPLKLRKKKTMKQKRR